MAPYLIALGRSIVSTATGGVYALEFLYFRSLGAACVEGNFQWMIEYY